jgi:hypothetical protein
MPREDKQDKSHWEGRQRDVEYYWAGRQAYLKRNLAEKDLNFERISTPHGRKYAEKLLEDEHSDIAVALDSVLIIPGLRAGYWPKLIHKVIYMKCNEVSIARDLDHMLLVSHTL